MGLYVRVLDNDPENGWITREVMVDVTGALPGDVIMLGVDGVWRYGLPPMANADDSGASTGDVLTYDGAGNGTWKPGTPTGDGQAIPNWGAEIAELRARLQVVEAGLEACTDVQVGDDEHGYEHADVVRINTATWDVTGEQD